MPYDLVVVGASLGGLHAISSLLAALPPGFAAPLVIVQHRVRDGDDTLRLVLDRAGALPVVEARDKQALLPGAVYLAPADYHLLVEAQALALSTDPPVHYARPAIDVLFESAADAYGARLLGLLLTGASADGALGLAAIKARGGCAVVQDPADAECRVMPEAALAATEVDYVLPLAAIPELLIRLCQIIPKVGA